MKCADRVFIQKYIDSEMDINTMRIFDKHIIRCQKCSELFDEVESLNRIAESKMKGYAAFLEKSVLKNNKLKRQKLRKGPGQFSVKSGKRLFAAKKGIAAACILVLLSASIAIQPVRAVIAETLKIFRMDEVKGINISLDDINMIKKQLEQGSGDISLDRIGRISLVKGERKNVAPYEAKNKVGFEVKYPAVFSGAAPHTTLMGETTLELNLNVKNINEVLKSFGGEKILPPEIDGRTVSLDIAKSVVTEYNVSGVSCEIVQTRLPVLQVPDDVDVDGIYEAFLQLPLLPDNLKRQLKSTKDWKSTIYIPLIETKGREVNINGYTGYLYSDDIEGTATKSWLIWNENGIIRGIESYTDPEKLLEIALSMR